MESESIERIMVDITQKQPSQRKATAQATLRVSSEATMEAIRNRQVPKGDVLEFARAAGLLAVKNTAGVIPDCHPLPIEYTAIRYTLEGLTVEISVEVHTIYKTGVEVEAMHGAAIVALTLYDMLKPIDKGIEIGQIRLLHKSGGKSQLPEPSADSLRAAVMVCSDSLAAGRGEDLSGRLIREKLESYGLAVEASPVVPDDIATIQRTLKDLTAAGIDLVICSGGTGLSPRDVTPEAVAPLLDREIPGIMETTRQYGQQRTPYAMLSRGVAGFIGKTLVITLPGSPKGVAEGLSVLFPHILHLFRVATGWRHEA